MFWIYSNLKLQPLNTYKILKLEIESKFSFEKINDFISYAQIIVNLSNYITTRELPLTIQAFASLLKINNAPEIK